MLTTKNTSAKKASEYFLQGYYQEGTSRWFGIGAEKLGLAGAVDNQEVFNNIVQSKSPDGTQQLCARQIKAESRRAAVDCTFEAPKSISITALPGGDERLAQCHVKAVEQTLALIQEYCAHTRVTVDKERHLVNTKNLVVAQFDHTESRDLDPHLHTHCLLMNMVQTQKGEWYSHVNDAIVQQKKYWGMVYQQFLAAEVQKLGYEIEWKAHGQFELKGYTEEEVKEFSKRRQEILAVAGSNSTWAEREKAWRATRKRKEEVKPEELLARWKEEAELLGIQFVQPTIPPIEIEQTASQQKIQVESLPVTQVINQKLVDDAIRHCSSKNVTFALEDLERFVLEAVGTTIDPKQMKPLFYSHPELKRLELKRGVRYTTQTALWQDRATIYLMRQGQGAVAAIARPNEVKAHLEQTELNAGQRSAVMLAATTTDQFILLEGVAGSGKTWMLRELKAIAQPHNYIFKGFGVTSEAEKELWKKAGIESTTLASLLCSPLPLQPQPNQIWVVDEAGMSSAKDCYQLLKRATAENARVILVGDKRQFSAVEAGNPFKLLQQEGILTAYMEESVRQKNPELKVAVDLIAQGKIRQGFARLEDSGRIIECDGDTQAGAIVSEYMKVLPERRADTLVLVGTHKERLLITQAIRDALKTEGSLGQEEVKLTALRSIEGKNDLSKVKLEYTHNFEVGNIVIPTRSYKRRQLEKGVAYEVVGKTKDHLHLLSPDGSVLTVDPKFDKSVYSQQEIAIAVGDRLRWTKRSKNLGRYNGDELVVTAIADNQATLQYSGSDRTETIDLTQPHHLDYTVVRTGYSAQGKDADIVLIAADKCVSSESFYVAVSRVKQELKVFTQDPETLLTEALVSNANKSALDEWREHIEMQMKAKAAAQLKVANPTPCIQEIGAIQLTATPEASAVSKPAEDELEIALEDNPQPLSEIFDAASLGQSIAQQLSSRAVQVQLENTQLLYKASNQLQLKQNPPIPIPPLQEKTNRTTAVEQLPPQVFMGSQPQPAQFEPIKNHGAAYKPIGGIWTSNYQPDYGSEWSAFVHQEEMTVNPHKQHLWLVIPKPDLKILVVDSQEELKALPHLSPRIEDDDVCPLDYEAIAKQYDAMAIKPQLLRGCMEVASFDVESTIWFGSRGYPFASVKPLVLPEVNQQTSQSNVNSASNELLNNTDQNQKQPTDETEITKDLELWKRVAQALGKPQAYINHIAATAREVKGIVPLPEIAITSMQDDILAYLKRIDSLKQWYDAAAELGKSRQYLSEITEIIKDFYHPTQPKPLTEKAIAALQQDIDNCNPATTRAETHSLPKEEQKDWQYYSQLASWDNHLVRARVVAIAALKDRMEPDRVREILANNPDWQKESPEVLHGHIESTMRYAQFLVDSQKSDQQQINHQEYQQQNNQGLIL